MKLAIIDFNGTLYDPETDQLMGGAKELLDGLKAQHIAMVLVSRQEFGGAHDELTRLAIRDYFSDTYFVLEKTGQLFAEIMSLFNATPLETIVIGDHPYSEIKAGNDIGAFTILLKSSYLPQHVIDEVRPRAIVTNLSDVTRLL